MANCVLCSTELKFINTPTFGSGKLSDRETVCFPCYKKINSLNPKVASNLKNHSSADIKKLHQEILLSEKHKVSRIDEIKNQIQNLNLSNGPNFLGRREINELPNILAANETINNLAQGIYNNGQGILVSTNRRLLFVDKGMLYGLKVEDFPLDKITSIQYETGLLLGKIKIHTSGNVAEIKNVDNASARNFSEFVRDKISQPKEIHTTTSISEPNILDQLEKLAKLKENGILSEDEFNEHKNKLLQKL